LAALSVVAVTLVHHYSFLTTILSLVASLLFAPSRKSRRVVLQFLVAGLLASLPLWVRHYLSFLDEVHTTSVLLFREPPLTLWFVLQSLNPAFVVSFATAQILTRRLPATSPRLLILAWLVCQLGAFVSLEYLYRGGSLLWTGGEDCYTAFTPSRMLSNLAYPMSILCGALALALPSLGSVLRRCGMALFLAAALGPVGYVWQQQKNVGVEAEALQAGLWLRANTPNDAFVVGSTSHLAYTAWRATSHPPLPASEPREDPKVSWRKQMGSLDDWLQWARREHRPIYFVEANGRPPPPFLREVYSGEKLKIYSLRRGGGGEVRR
jgi:hypothetical protein